MNVEPESSLWCLEYVLYTRMEFQSKGQNHNHTLIFVAPPEDSAAVERREDERQIHEDEKNNSSKVLWNDKNT